MWIPPACARCRFRKIKCDRKAPKCSACDKCRSSCLIYDQIAQQSYTRQHVQDLIDEVRKLEACAGSGEEEEEEEEEEDERSGSTGDGASVDLQPSPGQRFVGESSGISFLRYVFESANWKVAQIDLTRYLRQQHAILNQPISVHDWPPFDQAQTLVHSYLTNSHTHHPFLHPRDVRLALKHAYEDSEQRSSSQESYLLFMVFAIASVQTFRKGLTSQHPYGYFLAAQRYQDDVSVVGNLQAIQNLSLLARFGMYHDINTSIWELSRICMRQCVELNLHLPPNGTIDLNTEQLQRCVFWDCYMNERYSAGTLGRPIAIADQDIKVSLPLEIDDEELDASTSLPSSIVPLGQPTVPNAMSVFLFAVGLRRIQSRNATAFDALGKKTKSMISRHLSICGPGMVMYELETRLSELSNWLLTAPFFPSPQSLYQRSEWYAFLVEKEKLSVIRAAMACLSQFQTQPLRTLLAKCVDCAAKVIELYTQMFDALYITWTRNYFQALFAAGLSLIFCTSVLGFDTVDTGGAYHATGEESDALRQDGSRMASALCMCSRVLLRFSKEMPDSRAFYLVFEALRKRFSPKITRVNSDMLTSDLSTANSYLNSKSTAFGNEGGSAVDHAAGSGADAERPLESVFKMSEQNRQRPSLQCVPTNATEGRTSTNVAMSSNYMSGSFPNLARNTFQAGSLDSMDIEHEYNSDSIRLPRRRGVVDVAYPAQEEPFHGLDNTFQAQLHTAGPVPIEESLNADLFRHAEDPSATTTTTSTGGTNLLRPDQFPLKNLEYFNDLPDWTVTFTDEVMENMVDGLGEYVWGNPATEDSIWNQIDFRM